MACNVFPYQARTFRWRIRNFHASPHLPGQSILSPPFSFEPAGFLNLHLRLYPRGKSDSDSGRFVSLYLVRDPLDHGPKRVCVDYRLTLGWGAAEHAFEDCTNVCRGSENGNPRLVQRQKLEGDDDLLVTCEFAVGDQDGATYCPWEADAGDLEKLSSDFRDALQSGKHSDLKLKSSDGFLFDVHKSIVLHRFPGMIESLGSREEENEEHVLDIGEPGLRSLLTYLYSGTLEAAGTSDIPYEMLRGLNNSQLESLLFPIPSAESVTTTVTIKRGSFVWTIPGFWTSPGGTDWLNTFCIDEHIVLLITCERTKLTIQRDDADNSEEDCVYFTIRCLSPDAPLFLQCHISESESGKGTQIFNHLLKPGETWNVPPFELLNGVQGDTLKINFVLRVSDGRLVTEIESCHALEVKQRQLKTNLWALQEDMIFLYTKSCMSDVVIDARKCRIHSHRCVLSSRSAIFSKILEEKTHLGDNTVELDLKDLDEQAVKCLLQYMYCGEVVDKPRDLCAIVNLYVAASRYQVELLKEKCMSCLKRELTAETVFKMVAQVSKYDCGPLKDLAKTFLYVDREEIFNSREWESLRLANTYMLTDMENIISVPGEAMSDILWDMLLCMRLGGVHRNKMDVDRAIELYEYALQYKLFYMKKQYISVIFNETNEKNVDKVIALSNKCRDKKLKEKVHYFIRCNAPRILNSEKLKTCNREDLAEDLAKIASHPKRFSTYLIKNVLTYLDTGKFLDMGGIADIARSYIETCASDLPHLRERFGSLLGSLITADNVGEMSVISHMSGDEEVLKEHITNFIVSNGDEIVKTDKWEESARRSGLMEDTQAIALSPPELRPTLIAIMLAFLHSGLPNTIKIRKTYGDRFAARGLTTNQLGLDFLIHLYLKAREYPLHATKQSCVSYLRKFIRVSNVGVVLVIASRNNDEVLKECVATYVSSHREFILKSSDWKIKFQKISGRKKYPKALLDEHGKDFQVEEILTMLLYMHGNSEEYDVMKLHQIADTFNLPKLKSDCCSLMRRVN